MPPVQHANLTRGAPRPIINASLANPQLRQLDINKLPPVKFQRIKRPEAEVLVGRVKIQTPGGHGFILRRYDTEAVSLTTMFRVAFPNAGEELEKAELAWVKANCDTAGTNGSKAANSVRFAGTWVTSPTALKVADGYGLLHVVRALIAATPDDEASPERKPRKASPTKAAAPAPAPPSATKKLPTPSPSHPAKRRKESSPAPSVAPAAAKSPSPAPLRRSTRTRQPSRSPAPTSVSPSKVSKAAPRRLETIPATPADEDAAAAEDMVQPNISQDIAEQKELIAELKAQREAAGVVAVGPVDAEEMGAEELAAAKRPREDEETPLQFDFKEPEVAERAIATNRRVRLRLLDGLPPERKSMAWGALALAAGFGAVTFFPNYIPSFF